VIHSVHPVGGLFVPWSLAGEPRGWMLQFAGAYAVLAALLVALAQVEPKK
jgi:AGZA family xanthine/uracil permease-like MFS transporter